MRSLASLQMVFGNSTWSMPWMVAVIILICSVLSKGSLKEEQTVFNFRLPVGKAAFKGRLQENVNLPTTKKFKHKHSQWPQVWVSTVAFTQDDLRCHITQCTTERPGFLCPIKPLQTPRARLHQVYISTGSCFCMKINLVNRNCMKEIVAPVWRSHAHPELHVQGWCLYRPLLGDEDKSMLQQHNPCKTWLCSHPSIPWNVTEVIEESLWRCSDKRDESF